MNIFKPVRLRKPYLPNVNTDIAHQIREENHKNKNQKMY